jgi:hypothetical protein
MKLKGHERSGLWQRDRQRAKAKKPKPTACTCPPGGRSTTCPQREHRERAKAIQGVGIDPESQL